MMEDWVKVTLILCLFGTLRELRPSEPFVSEFLLGKWRNVTEAELNRNVYPVGTYSYLAQLVVIFLITDFLRFKPVIILSGVSGIVVYAILLWTKSIEWLKVCQFFYGMFMATEIAYYTYIYAKVDAAKYLVVSSYTRIAALAGRFVSGSSAQLLIHYHVMDYRQLNYITFAAQLAATFWALWLPSVQYGIYFHRRSTASNGQTDLQAPLDKIPVPPEERPSCHKRYLDALSLIVRHARAAYSRRRVLAWSALYATDLALFVQAETYVQLLWMFVQAETHAPVAFNGAVEAIMTLVGALAAYLASLFAKDYLPCPVVFIQACAMFVGTYVPNIYVSYAGYIVMGSLFHYNITLASAKIAALLTDESCFGLVFGMNTLVGTGLQSILTAILIQSLKLPITSQFCAISVLYLILAIVWLIGIIVIIYRKRKAVNVATVL